MDVFIREEQGIRCQGSRRRGRRTRGRRPRRPSPARFFFSLLFPHHEGQDLLVEELVVGLAAVVLGGGFEVGEQAGAVEGLGLVLELAEAADDAREETPDVVALRRLTRRLRGGRRGLPRLRREAATHIGERLLALRLEARRLQVLAVLHRPRCRSSSSKVEI